MAPDELRARAARLRLWWEQLGGVPLFRAIACDLLAATDADRASLLLHGTRRPRVVGASDARAAALDTIVTDALSPGCRALMTGRTIVIDDVLDRAEAWDTWCALAVASNVTAVMSIPLTAGTATVAAVTLFADAPGHFGADRVAVATTIAGAAAQVVVAELRRSGAPREADPLAALARGPGRRAVALRGDPSSERWVRVLRGLASAQAAPVLRRFAADRDG